MKKITAIVVTYNRKKLLLECLDALRGQTYPLHRIILIDNASTDGTREEVEQKQYTNLQYVMMEKNAGGAGGFYEGLRQALDSDSDYVWIMDDDTIPSPDSLQELLNAEHILREEGEDCAFLASAVYGPHGEAMNLPMLDTRREDNGYSGWYRQLHHGMVSIRAATFVSLLVPMEKLRMCGLPYKDFFIWGDDTEFTMRLSTYAGKGYFVGKSVVCHKRTNCRSLNIYNEQNAERIGNYRYFYRNQLMRARYYDHYAGYLRCKLRFILTVLSHLKDPHGFKKTGIVFRGMLEYRKVYPHMKAFIDSQISGIKGTSV